MSMDIYLKKHIDLHFRIKIKIFNKLPFIYFSEDTDMFQKLYQIPFCLGMLLLTSLGNKAFTETPTNSVPPTIGMLNMPPVTPQEAAEYLNKRVVPTSSFASYESPYAKSQEYSGEKDRLKLNVDAVIGHEPPAGAITKYGFKRADLAPKSSSVIKHSENANYSGTATTVIIPKKQTSPEQITTVELPELRENKKILTK
ncbi:hypothetical protein ABLA30_10590 [Xenorhabdus nematophila]